LPLLQSIVVILFTKESLGRVGGRGAEKLSIYLPQFLGPEKDCVLEK
jgi:hypothetical protein